VGPEPGTGEGAPLEGWDEAVLSIEGGDPEGEDESLGVEGATRRRVGFPYVRFPRLALPLPGVEPKGLEETRPVLEKPPAPEEPKVTVLLYNHNDSDRLWNLMFALKAQTRVPDEILLVDNHSEDASVSFLRGNYPEVRVMELQEVFPEEQAWNLGFLAATGDLVAMVDLSLALPPEWLRRAVEAFKTRALDAGGVLCPVVGPKGAEGAPIYNVLGRVVGTEAPFPGGKPFAIPSGAWVARRRVFQEGPYEEDLPGGADPLSTGWRLRALGSHATWAFDARVLRPAEALEPPPAPFWVDLKAERRRARVFWAFAERSTLLKLAPLWFLEAAVRPFGRWFHPEGSFWGTLLGLLLVPFTLWGGGKGRGDARPGKTVPDKEVLSGLSSRIATGDGAFASLWNAFCAAYLTAVGLPTLETLAPTVEPRGTPSA